MDVDAILSSKRAKFKTTDVSREVELQCDLGNLLASDLNTLDVDSLRGHTEEYLKELSRDNTQLLLNKLWELPTNRDEGFVLAELPPCTTILPREKPIPQPKSSTKWEEFSKAKGIRKLKRSRMVFDEEAQEWKPRWGYKRVKDDAEDWVLEVPENADPYEDQFEKKRRDKKEGIAKNEYQRLRNIASAQKRGRVKVPLPPPEALGKAKKHELTHALGMAKKATASVGKFTPSLPKEPVLKGEKKRRFTSVTGDFATEKQKNLDILGKISKNKPILNVNKAANTRITSEQKSGGKKRKSESGARDAGKKFKRSKGGGGTKKTLSLKSKTLGGRGKRKK